VRSAFIEYIKLGTWIDKLSLLEDDLQEEDAVSLWTKCFPDVPKPDSKPDIISPGSIKSLLKVLSSQTLTSMTSGGTQTASSNCEETDLDLPKWVVCERRDDMRALLVFALLPFFLRSSEYRTCKDPQTIPSGSSSPSDSYSRFKAERTQRSTRLRGLLHSAAVQYDSADLEQYLSSFTTDIISDFRAAIENLPMKLRVLEMSKLSWQPSTLFETSGKLSTKSLSSRSGGGNSGRESTAASLTGFGSSRVQPSSRSAKEPEYTPEQVESVQTAINERRQLKLVVATCGGKQCILRALKPIFAPDGRFKFMISVETTEKISAAEAWSHGSSAQIFQQIDDVLLLLPLVIKA
jgi:hypothetical protein